MLQQALPFDEAEMQQRKETCRQIATPLAKKKEAEASFYKDIIFRSLIDTTH